MNAIYNTQFYKVTKFFNVYFTVVYLILSLKSVAFLLIQLSSEILKFQEISSMHKKFRAICILENVLHEKVYVFLIKKLTTCST